MMADTVDQLATEPWGPIETSGFWDGTVFVCGRVRWLAAEDPTRIIAELGPVQPGATAIRPTVERRNPLLRSRLQRRPPGERSLPRMVQDMLRTSWVPAHELDEVPVNGRMF